MRKRREETGTSLIETMFAVLISLVAIASLGSAIVQATVADKNQGGEVTRATIYAQDKIENLLSLNFSTCTQTSTSQPVGCNTTGITASGWTQGLLSGGALTPPQLECPVSGSTVGYVDFLDASGAQIIGDSCSVVGTGAGIPGYIRQWEVQDLASSGPALKQITVSVYAANGVNAGSGKPIVTLTSVLSN